MTSAQAWFVIGGMFNLLFSSLAAYALYWVRLRDPVKPVPHYGLITHTSSITLGLVLIALSVVIELTNFTPTINTGLAVAAVVSTLLTDARNLWMWVEGLDDGFAEVNDTRRRLRGLTNIINLVVMASIFYGIVRATLGL